MTFIIIFSDHPMNLCPCRSINSPSIHPSLNLWCFYHTTPSGHHILKNGGQGTPGRATLGSSMSKFIPGSNQLPGISFQQAHQMQPVRNIFSISEIKACMTIFVKTPVQSTVTLRKFESRGADFIFPHKNITIYLSFY